MNGNFFVSGPWVHMREQPQCPVNLEHCPYYVMRVESDPESAVMKSVQINTARVGHRGPGLYATPGGDGGDLSRAKE